MDTKQIIAENIANLRIANNLTQIELAKKLNYSDKSVSKWERGESVPDITVLLKISELFDVSIDYIVKHRHTAEEIKDGSKSLYKKMLNNRGFIMGMCIILVWALAVIAYITVKNTVPASVFLYLVFCYAAVLSLTVWLIFNSIWFNKRLNYIIISLLMWFALFSIHLSLLLTLSVDVYALYFLGVLGEIIIFFWSRLKY